MANKLRVELQAKIRKYLRSGRKESDYGGWPKVTDEEMKLLYDIIEWLIMCKYDHDADGDYPVLFDLTDWTRQVPMHYRPLPHYAGSDVDPATRKRAMELAYMNLRIAQDQFDTVWRVFQDKIQIVDKEEKDDNQHASP